MKAAWFDRFGPAREVLTVGERPVPEPGPGEVLVALHSSAVNPSDVKKRAGSVPDLLQDGYVIPDSDGAGVIEAVGERVHPGRIGERVWVYQAQHKRRLGTAAEYVAIDASRAVALPDSADFAVGACMGIPAMTAHRCVFADGPVHGTTVLVTGGAGRVGWYAVQWAARAGATVIATASNEADAEICREAGARHVVSHREAGWARQVLECNEGRKVDRVVEVDFGGNLSENLELVRTSGTIATYASMGDTQPCLPFYRMMFLDLTLRLVIVYDMPESAKQQAISDIGLALGGGWMKHRIAHRVALDEAARAHELIEQGGFRGCVVLDTR